MYSEGFAPAWSGERQVHELGKLDIFTLPNAHSRLHVTTR